MIRASTATTPPTMVARSIMNAHALRDLAQRSWASEVILPDTCPDRGSGWSFRRSGRYSRLSVKPSAQPALVRTRYLPSLLARRKAPRSRPHWPQQRTGIALLAFGRHITAHVGMPGFHPCRRDRALRSLTSTARQNNRFWMAAAILTVIVPGIPRRQCAAGAGWLTTLCDQRPS